MRIAAIEQGPMPIINRGDNEEPSEHVTLFPVMSISQGNSENLNGEQGESVPLLPVNNVSPGTENDQPGAFIPTEELTGI